MFCAEGVSVCVAVVVVADIFGSDSGCSGEPMASSRSGSICFKSFE